MQALYNFVVEPIGERYSNTTKVGDKELILNTDISLAVSGIAGPDGGSKDKPVGLVHHCVSNLENKNIHRKIIHVGNREDIRNKTAETIFDMILEQILQI